MDRAPKYDAAIIGAGQAGVPLAKALAKAGWRTALVEREHVGGTCINEGCTPTKTMIASARVAEVCRRAPMYGVGIGEISVDLAAVRQRKRDVVTSWRDGAQGRLQDTSGLDLIMGEAAFLGPHALTVDKPGAPSMTIETDQIFVNTGSRPAVPPLPGIESVPYLTSTTAMELDTVPDHLLILGGGYVAVEFAQMFRRFGSDVTVLEKQDSVLSREDPDVSEAVADILEEDGIRVILGADVGSATVVAEDRVRLQFETAEGAASVDGSHLLVATGRLPNTEVLNLEAAGLEVDAGGYLPVNERLETRVEGIYALGDVKGGPAFTHISYDDFRILRTNLLDGGSTTTTGRMVPYVVYLDPQLGRVGLTEREAQERGIDFRVLTVPMSHSARALERDEPRGFIKAVVDGVTDRILGCAVLAIEGGELMSLLQVAMMGKITAAELREAIFAHPTLAESINNLFAH